MSQEFWSNWVFGHGLVAFSVGMYVFICWHERTGFVPFNALAKIFGANTVVTTNSRQLDDLYETVKFYNDRDQFKRKLARIIEERGQLPEPKTAAGHLGGWAARVGAILGIVGGAAGLVIGDILAWQNLNWMEGVGATAVALAVGGGTVWYVCEEVLA